MKTQDLENLERQIKSILGNDTEVEIEKFETNDREYWFTIRTNEYRISLNELQKISKMLKDKDPLISTFNDKIKILAIIELTKKPH